MAMLRLNRCFYFLVLGQVCCSEPLSCPNGPRKDLYPSGLPNALGGPPQTIPDIAKTSLGPSGALPDPSNSKLYFVPSQSDIQKDVIRTSRALFYHQGLIRAFQMSFRSAENFQRQKWKLFLVALAVVQCWNYCCAVLELWLFSGLGVVQKILFSCRYNWFPRL